MTTSGGLKLALRGAGREDRRLRSARVYIAAVGEDHEVGLVTDSRGRMRYRLAPGEYRLRLEQGGETRFAVAEGWTTVRVSLS